MAAADLLAAWERGSTWPLSDRAVALVELVDPGCPVDDLTVGQCDTLLYDVHARLFGDELEVVTTCPACRDQVDLALSVAAVLTRVDVAAPPADVVVTRDGVTVVCRVPLNRDFRALSRLGELVTDVDITSRCVLSASGPSGPLRIEDLDGDLVAEALERLAEADPAAHVLLAVSCPCGATWDDQLDIRTVLWAELDAWVTDLLHDVHQLATAYGWSESDILELSAWRRDWYRQAVGS